MTPQELKYSILGQAFTGKLCEQSHTLDFAKIKTVSFDEAPFEIPETWLWSTLGLCSEMYTGNSISESVKSGKYAGLQTGYDYIATKDVSFTQQIYYDNGVKIPYDEGFKVAHKDAVLMCIEGGSAGRKIGILDRDVCFGNKLCSFHAQGVDNKYLFYYLQSWLFKELFSGNMTGIIGGVSIKKLKEIAVPIAPISEQKRIVAKLEEILPLIDRYEAAWNKLEEFNKCFPGDMQKSILQLAIQGKLVEQRPEEGTGEELFQQIQAEKQALIKAGKIKKEKPLPEITEDEIPFDIPETWKWARLGNLSWYFDAGKSPNCLKQPVTGNDWGVITTTAVQLGYFDEVQNKILPPNFAVNPEIQVRSGDILITRAGPTNRTGIACLVKDIHYNLILSDKIIRINLTDNYFYKDYLIMVLNSPQIRNLIVGLMSGMDKQQVNVSQDKYKTLLIPIPPLAEQKRIVAKLEEILPLCDRLK